MCTELGGELMRRRLLINDSNGASEGVAYSGTLKITERTYDDVIFECPGVTHFAIMLSSEPDLTTGKAFLCSFMSDTVRRIMEFSGQAGTSVIMGENKSTLTSSSTYPSIEYTATGVRFFILSPNDYSRWFQPGTYDWIAW